jgi:hypothetical protein
MSINTTQTLSVLQTMLRDQLRPAAEQATAPIVTRFSARLDAALEKGDVSADTSPEQAQHVAELLQLTSLRSSMELLTDHAEPDSGWGLSQSVPSLQAYLANLAGGEAPRAGRTAGQPLPELEAGPQAAEQVGQRQDELSDPSHPVSLEHTIEKAARRYGVETGLIKAVIKAESNFNPRAVSSAGAQGLMQLMPTTARGLGVSDPFDPEQNVMAGTRFLKGLLERYNGDLDTALAAYNWGPGNVDRRPDRLPRETRDYLVKVKQFYNSYNS